MSESLKNSSVLVPDRFCRGPGGPPMPYGFDSQPATLVWDQDSGEKSFVLCALYFVLCTWYFVTCAFGQLLCLWDRSRKTHGREAANKAQSTKHKAPIHAYRNSSSSRFQGA